MFKVKSLMNLLEVQQMPRRLYQASCSHVFGDVMCGYDRVNGVSPSFGPTGNGQFTITADPSSTQSQITATVSSFGPIFINGTIIGLTGANAGYARTIANVISPTIYFKKAFPFAVTAGDTFNILPGCDHTLVTCSGTFQNIGRFGGFPFIPPPEFAA